MIFRQSCDSSLAFWQKADTQVACMPSNTALQTDKGKLSRLLHSQKPRQLTFAAELGR
jgi:hypothetical protein